MKYLRIWEWYVRRPGLQDSYRKRFAHHYGQITAQDSDGTPERKPTDPVDIRIDNKNDVPHMHYGAPQPHHQQANVQGLELQNITMFNFVNGVLRHRSTGRTIKKIFHFRIV